MNKVMIICSNFLPVRNGGTIRCEKLVKYLPEFEWESVVLTKKPSKSQKLDHTYSLNNCKIYRSKRFDLALILVRLRVLISNLVFFQRKKTTNTLPNDNKQVKVNRRMSEYFLLPDSDIFWALGAVIKGFFIIKKENPQIIFSSGPSQSVHIIGLILKKITNKKLVIEFRDPWTMNPFNIPKPFKLLTIIDSYLEKIVLKNADKINVTSIEYKNQFLNKYKFIPDNKIINIPNGYDPDDFKYKSLNKNKKFTVVHTGNFYQHRSSSEFIKAVLYLFDNNLLPTYNITFKFLGLLDEKGKSFIMNSKFSNNFELMGQVSHVESINEVINADLLLLIPGPGNGTTPGKFYEYLAASKPIFCISDEGPPKELINKYSLGVVCRDNDIKEMATKLKCFIENIEAKNFYYPNIDQLKNQFNRKNIAERMSEVFDNEIKSNTLDL